MLDRDTFHKDSVVQETRRALRLHKVVTAGTLQLVVRTLEVVEVVEHLRSEPTPPILILAMEAMELRHPSPDHP